MTKAEKLARWMHKAYNAWAKRKAELMGSWRSWEKLSELSREKYMTMAALLLSEKADKILGRKR